MAEGVAMNQRVQGILLELMRERHSVYADCSDVELKSILKTGAGDAPACGGSPAAGAAVAVGGGAGAAAGEALSAPPRAGDGGYGGEAVGGSAPPIPGDPGSMGGGAGSRSPRSAPDGGDGPKKKRHRPSRDRARDRIERRVPLTRDGVDALDWNEACEYAKSMGVSKKSHTTRDAYRDACRGWFDGREGDVFTPATVPQAPRQRWQRAGPEVERRAAGARRRAEARAWATGSEESEGERDERNGDQGGNRGFDRSAIARRLANRTADRDDIARLMACSSRPPRSRMVAADTIEASSDEEPDDDDDERRDIAELLVAGARGC